MDRKLGIALLLAFAPAVWAQDEWGEKPDQAKAEELATAAFQGLLKDPYSAHIRYEQIIGTSGYPTKTGVCRGWVLQAYVNAKNGYGGYTGEEPYRFYINRDTIACAFGTRSFNGGPPQEIRVL